MVCRALARTHVQAFIRTGGMAVSILTGIIVTALLFSLSLLPLMPESNPDPGFSAPVQYWLCVAIFFFAVHDIYPTILLVTFIMVFLWASSVDPVYLHVPNLSVYAAAVITAGVLAGMHRHYSLYFTTIFLPAQ